MIGNAYFSALKKNVQKFKPMPSEITNRFYKGMFLNQNFQGKKILKNP